MFVYVIYLYVIFLYVMFIYVIFLCYLSLCYISSADDCFQLGVIAYNKADWYHSILWMSKSLRLDETEPVKTARRADILDYLSFSTFKVC